MVTTPENDGGDELANDASELRDYDDLLWERYLFRKGKVWVIVDSAGHPRMENDGRVLYRYRVEDDRTYSTWPDKIAPIEPGPPTTRVQRERTPKSKKKRKRRSMHLSREVVIDGQSEEGRALLSDPEIVHIWVGAVTDALAGTAWAYKLSWREHDKTCVGTLDEGDESAGHLEAVDRAFEAMKDPQRRIVVHSTSPWLIRSLTEKVKLRVNAQRVRQVRATMAKMSDVYFHLFALTDGDEGMTIVFDLCAKELSGESE